MEYLLSSTPDFSFEWDFNNDSKDLRGTVLYQKAWNQTLVTKINQTSANIFKKTERGGANVINIHPKLAPLFFTLEYYHVSGAGYKHPSGSLSGRYRVFYSDELPEDMIYMFNGDKHPDKKNCLGVVNVKNFDEEANKEVVLDDINHMVRNGLTEDEVQIIKEYLRFY